MKWIFLINVVISLAVALMIFFNYIACYRNKKTSQIVNYFSLVSVIYFFIFIFSVLWFFEVLDYNSEDFLFIYSLAVFIQSIFFFVIIFLLSKNKKIYHFSFFYLIVLFSFFTAFFNFLYLFLITSFLVSIFIFVYLSNFYSNSGKVGIVYSVISLILSLLFLFGIGNLLFLSFFSNLLFLILTKSILKEFGNVLPGKTADSVENKASFFIKFMRFFVFILVLSNFAFISTITLHEFGHFSIANFYKCEYNRIVYEKSLHTEILCDYYSSKYLSLGGILLPFFAALILLLVGGRFLKDIAFLIIGFDLIASNQDFYDLGFSQNISTFLFFLGVLSIIVGIVLLAKSRISHEIYL